MKRIILISIFSLFIAACQPVVQNGQEQVAPTETPRPTAEAAQRTTYSVERGDVREEYTFTGRWLPRDHSYPFRWQGMFVASMSSAVIPFEQGIC